MKLCNERAVLATFEHSRNALAEQHLRQVGQDAANTEALKMQ